MTCDIVAQSLSVCVCWIDLSASLCYQKSDATYEDIKYGLKVASVVLKRFYTASNNSFVLDKRKADPMFETSSNKTVKTV